MTVYVFSKMDVRDHPSNCRTANLVQTINFEWALRDQGNSVLKVRRQPSLGKDLDKQRKSHLSQEGHFDAKHLFPKSKLTATTPNHTPKRDLLS